MALPGIRNVSVMLVVVAVVVGSAPVVITGADAAPGVQNPTDIPDEQLFEGSDDGQIEVWNRAAYPIRSNDTAAQTQVDFPVTLNGQRLADGEDFSSDNDGTDTKDLNPASFDGERNPAGVHNPGEVFISFDGNRAGSSALDNQGNISFLAANVTGEGGQDVPADYSSAVDLLSDIDNANENATFRMLEANTTLNSDSETTLSPDFDPGYHIIYASVRQDGSAGFQVDSEGNVSVDGDVAIVAVERVAVQEESATVTEPSDPSPGDTLDFDINVSSPFAPDKDGQVTHTVALYNKSTFEDSRKDIVTNDSKFGPNFNISNGSQVEHSIENTTGVADVDDGIEISGVNLSDGRVARTVGMGAIVDRFAEDLSTSDPIIDPIVEGGSSSSETEDIFASVNATSGLDRDTTVSVDTYSTFSEGEYQYIVYSQLDNDATRFSTASGTLSLESDDDGGGIGGGGGGGIGGVGGGGDDDIGDTDPDEIEPPSRTVTGEVSQVESGESASGTISAANASDVIRFESNTTSEDDQATLEGVDIEFGGDIEDASVEVSTTTEPPAGAPSLGPDQAIETVGYIETNVEGINDTAISRSAFNFRVSQERLVQAGARPENVRLFRVEDGTPTALSTEHLGDDRYRATASGFSVFIIGIESPDITFVSGKIDRASVGVDETFTTTVRLGNDGNQSEEVSLTLEADGDIFTSETVTVAENEEMEFDLNASIDEAGTYDITVNGRFVRTLEVTPAETPSTPTATPSTPTATPTVTPTPQGEETSTITPIPLGEGTPTETPGADGPGFGVLVALLALLASLLALRRRH